MRTPTPSLVLLLMANLTVALPCAAADTVLLYGPAGPDAASEQRALASLNLLAAGPVGSPSVRHVQTVLASQPVIDVVGGEVRACPGSPVTVETFTEALDEALQHVLYQRLEDAGRTLERLDALLPCIHGVLPRGELARISFLEGVGQAYAGDGTAAQESFRRALVVSPELDWDDNFPPDYRALFDGAIQDALRSQSAPVSVEALVGQIAKLWVDGVEFRSGGLAMSLAEGRHLLQWELVAGGFSTRVTVVRAGDVLTVLSRDDLAACLLGGAGSDAVRVRAVDLLTTLATEAGVDRIHLAELGGVDLLHTFTPATGAWALTDQGLVTRRLQQQRRRSAGVALLVSGGTAAGAGMLVWGLGYAKGQELYEEAPNITSTEMYDQNVEDYHRFRTQANVGLVVTGIGAAALGTGIALIASGRERDPGRKGVAVQLAPGGVGIRGTW
jgi:hypothetical protein